MPDKALIYDHFIRGLAEFFANIMVMSLGCMSAIATPDYVNCAVQQGLGFGTMVMAAYQSFWMISGCHINPAITLSALIMGRINWIHALIYIPSQFLGALAGFYLAVAAVPFQAHYSFFTEQPFCLTIPNEMMGVKEYQAFIFEFLTTATWVYVMMAIWSKPNIGKTDSPALQLGVAILGLVTVSMEMTGGSMNPFRTLPPALYHGQYKAIWIYFTAPFSASVVITLLWKYVYNLEFLQNLTKKGGDAQNA